MRKQKRFDYVNMILNDYKNVTHLLDVVSLTISMISIV